MAWNIYGVLGSMTTKRHVRNLCRRFCRPSIIFIIEPYIIFTKFQPFWDKLVYHFLYLEDIHPFHKYVSIIKRAINWEVKITPALREGSICAYLLANKGAHQDG
ncbi:hypothetical protein SESBI_15255 [Sesbania bispinosa]|nr:hypothetical protein SESBI_15255 [Sesbania bispinosa]